MTIATITIETLQILNLIEKDLLAEGVDPIALGTDGNLRFQVLDDLDAAVSLASVTLIEMIFTKGTTDVVCSSATLITGVLYELAKDADQSFETHDANGKSTNSTGRGWYQFNYSSLLAWVTKMTPVRGRGRYKLRLTFTGPSVRTHFRGEYDIL